VFIHFCLFVNNLALFSSLCQTTPNYSWSTNLFFFLRWPKWLCQGAL